MALVRDDLGCQILGRAAERPCAVLQDLREPEVDELEVAVFVEQQILGLEVAVDDLERVHVRKHRGDGRRVKLGRLVKERRALREQREELTPERELFQHVELSRILVGVDEGEDERVVHHREDPLLVEYMRLLLRRHHLRLAHALERIRDVRRLVNHQLDAAKRADAQDAPDLQVGELGPLGPVTRGVALLHLLVDEVLERPEHCRERVAVARVANEMAALRHLDCRRRNIRLEQRTLAKKLARRERGKLAGLAAAGGVEEHLGRAALNHEEGVVLFALRDAILPRLVLLLLQLDKEVILVVDRELVEELDVLNLHTLEDLSLKVLVDNVLQVPQLLLERLGCQLEDCHRADRDHVRLPHGILRRRLEA
mmetsp:Transcript_5504/g.14531  ORF Transcript_5504/g.14531 Transcript_5504/m.14531 type:complete len:369 (-) Transcript_5504:845-1951(-)